MVGTSLALFAHPTRAVVPGRAKREPQMRNRASGNLEIPGSMLRIAPE
jgi:hypothetical protein